MKPIVRVLKTAVTLLLAAAVAVPAFAATWFSDVPDSHPHYADISDAHRRKWLEGYGDGKFRPDEPITPEQAVRVIKKAFGDDLTRAEFASVLMGGEERLNARKREDANRASRASSGTPTTWATTTTTVVPTSRSCQEAVAAVKATPSHMSEDNPVALQALSDQVTRCSPRDLMNLPTDYNPPPNRAKAIESLTIMCGVLRTYRAAPEACSEYPAAATATTITTSATADAPPTTTTTAPPPTTTTLGPSSPPVVGDTEWRPTVHSVKVTVEQNLPAPGFPGRLYNRLCASWDISTDGSPRFLMREWGTNRANPYFYSSPNFTFHYDIAILENGVWSGPSGMPVFPDNRRGRGCGLNGSVIPSGKSWDIEKVAIKVMVTPRVTDNIVREELPPEFHNLKKVFYICETIQGARVTLRVPDAAEGSGWAASQCPSLWE